jgi:hypothetical protein
MLLATTDRYGNLMVFLESLNAIEGALNQGRGKKLNRDKIGEFILAFDESKRLLSVVAREKVGFTSNLLDGSNEYIISFCCTSLSMTTPVVSRLLAARLT